MNDTNDEIIKAERVVLATLKYTARQYIESACHVTEPGKVEAHVKLYGYSAKETPENH
jgi:hypothetical protein